MAATISGQTTVTTAGTEVQLHSGLAVNGPVAIKALPGNTGVMYVGQQAGVVSSSTGYPLSAGQEVVFNQVGNLNEIWVDASVNGEKVAWLLLKV